MDISLEDLHLVIQSAFGWGNCHLFEFKVGEVRWGGTDKSSWISFDGICGNDASKTTLSSAIRGGSVKKFTYEYDFGDSWMHMATVVRIVEPLPDLDYPRLVRASDRCPPEDVGGCCGYAGFVEAMADDRHKLHEEMAEWYGEETFDPHEVDVDSLKAQVAGFAASLKRRTTP
jgi:hypothetical protein